jgi:glycosyltransferase involved in cell wall biosynthesis
MVHICFFSRSLLAHGIGGNERLAHAIIQGLARRGHRLTVLTTSHPKGLEREEAPGVEIHYLPETPAGRLGRAFWRASLRAFERLQGQDPADLVMDISLAGFGWAAEARQRWPLPFVAFMTGGWKDVLRNRWADVEGPLELAHFFLRALPEWWWGYRRWYKQVTGLAQRILVDHPSLKTILVREFGIDAGKIREAFSFADTERFRPDEALRQRVRKELGLSDEQPVVLMVAVLTRQKGIQVGLEALGLLRDDFPDLKALVLGNGPYRRSLEELSSKLGLSERVIFLGEVEPDCLPGFYNAADIFLNPTLRIEGLPLVISEALACGTPVITSAQGGIPDVIAHGQTGCLARAGDANGLAREIARLIENPRERQALAQAGLEFVRRNLTEEHFTDTVEKTILEVLGRPWMGPPS